MSDALQYQVVWPHCAVVNPADGTEKVLDKGAMLPDWVSDFTRFVLTTSGGVRLVETADPALLAEASPPDPVRLAEHPPAAPAPSPPPSGGGEAEPADDDVPPPSASKADWVDYAVSRGADRAEAERTSKEQLVGRYGRR